MLNLKSLFKAGLIAVFLAVPVDVFAVLFLSSGKYSFQIDVRNKLFQNIQWDAEGTASIEGKTARIDVSAKGYRSNYIFIPLEKNVVHYKGDIVLEDPEVLFRLENQDSEPVDSCEWDFGWTLHLYWHDEFGFNVVFPKAGFESITNRNIDLFVNGNRVGSRIYLTSVSDSWQLEVVGRRHELDPEIINHLTVVIKSQNQRFIYTEALLNDLVDDYLKNIEFAASARSEKEIFIVQCRLESIVKELTDAFPSINQDTRASIISKLLPESDLARSLKCIATFEEVHR